MVQLSLVIILVVMVLPLLPEIHLALAWWMNGIITVLSLSGANAIIVVNKQVWELQDDLSVIRSESGITSVGSGVYHALASVGTQIKLLDKKPTVKECEPILKLAYEVISEHVTSVSTKFNFLTQT